MHRNWLLEQLKNHSPFDPHEAEMRLRTIEFVTRNTACFDRSLAEGHITGSAWIANPSRTKILLTHHRKLNRWLQLGGHSDSEPITLNVALREAKEESGLKHIHAMKEDIFDIDIHTIPPHGGEPEHFHYDIRFFLQADDHAPLEISSESKDLAWIPLNKIVYFTDEISITRMVDKTLKLEK